MSLDDEVTRLGVTDLGSEVSDSAQQRILSGINVAGISTTEYMASWRAFTHAPVRWCACTMPCSS